MYHHQTKILIEKLNQRKDIKNWKFFADKTEKVTVGFDDNNYSIYKSPKYAESFSFNLIVQWADSKVSTIALCSATLEILDQIFDMAKFLSEDTGFYDLKLPLKEDLPDIKLFDSRIKNIVVDTPYILIEDLEKISKSTIEKDRNEHSINFTYTLKFNTRIISNPKNLISCDETLNYFFMSFDKYHSNTLVTRKFMDKDFLFDWSNNESNLNKLTKKNIDIPSNLSISIIFSPELTDLLLTKYFNNNLNIESIVENSSRFSIDEILKNSKIFSDNFYLVIDPSKDYLPSSYLVSKNGNIAKKYKLIEGGVLKNFICNEESCRHKYKPTIQLRDGRGFFIDPMTYKKLEDVEYGIYILKILGLKSQDSVSGDFSLRISEALIIKDGKPIGLNKNSLISGNFFDILSHDSTEYIKVNFKDQYSIAYKGFIYPA